MLEQQTIKRSERCVISVIGQHAGEGTETILNRKIADIEQTGKTFWMMRSRKASPPMVQRLCQDLSVYVIFIAPSTAGGARHATTSQQAIEYSPDKNRWHPIPENISPVSGKIDGRAAAFIFDQIKQVPSDTINLWQYADFDTPERPLKFMPGCSTICAVRKDMSAHPGKIKSRDREVVAVARLCKPYCVWLR